MNKKMCVILIIINTLCLSCCGKQENSGTICLIGTNELESTAPEYTEILQLLERQHELEVFMETEWEKKEGLNIWNDFEEYAQTVYTKEYVDYFFTPKYFGEDGAYYYLDEQGNLMRRESDGVVSEIQSNTLLKMTKSENAFAVVQECETDNDIEHRIYLILGMEDGFRIYAQIEE